MMIHHPVKNRMPAAMEAIVFRFSPQSMHSEHLAPSRNPDIFSGQSKSGAGSRRFQWPLATPVLQKKTKQPQATRLPAQARGGRRAEGGGASARVTGGSGAAGSGTPGGRLAKAAPRRAQLEARRSAHFRLPAPPPPPARACALTARKAGGRGWGVGGKAPGTGSEGSFPPPSLSPPPYALASA